MGRKSKRPYDGVGAILEGHKQPVTTDFRKSLGLGDTLEQFLSSLHDLDYPDYEIIVVDDGYTERKGEIVARYPEVRAIREV